MDLIIQNLDNWIIFFQELDKLKESKGSSILDDYIRAIEQLDEVEFRCFKSYEELTNIIRILGIDDRKIILLLLDKIRDIYRFNGIIESLEILRTYGVSKLIVINTSKGFYDIYGALESDVFVARDIIPYPKVDLNNERVLEVCTIKPFIVDYSGERIVYTEDFNLRGIGLSRVLRKE